MRWNIVEKKLCNLTQTIVSRRLHSASLASEGSCLTRAVSIARSFVSVTTKSWTLFKTVWRVSVLVNKELFISNIHRKTACNGGERVTKKDLVLFYHRSGSLTSGLLSCNNSSSLSCFFVFTPLFNDIRKRTRALAYIEKIKLIRIVESVWMETRWVDNKQRCVAEMKTNARTTFDQKYHSSL